MTEQTKIERDALLEACRNIVWKLSHNHKQPGYSGPAKITRQDATVRMAVEAIALCESNEPDRNLAGNI